MQRHFASHRVVLLDETKKVDQFVAATFAYLPHYAPSPAAETLATV